MLQLPLPVAPKNSLFFALFFRSPRRSTLPFFYACARVSSSPLPPFSSVPRTGKKIPRTRRARGNDRKKTVLNLGTSRCRAFDFSHPKSMYADKDLNRSSAPDNNSRHSIPTARRAPPIHGTFCHNNYPK